MAITKVINVDVNTGDAVAELDKLENSFKDVEKQAEKTDKSVDDVASNGGAIAILDQLTGGLATRLRDAYEASKLFNLSLKATRGALIATGIGAFVVALGTIVVLWDDIIAAIEDVNGKLDEQLETTQKIQDSLSLELGLLEKRIALSEKQGIANEQLQKQRIELVKLLQREQQEEIAILEAKAANLKASTLELNTREKILKTVYNILQAGAGDRFILDQQLEAANEYQAIQDLILKAKQDQLDLDIQLFDLQNPEVQQEDREQIQSIGTVGTDKLAEQLAEEERIREEARQQQINNELLKNVELERIAETSARVISDNEIKWADLTAEAKLGIAQTALGAVSVLVDQQSIAGKGIAIAQVGINTAQGIIKALAENPFPSPLGSIGAALVGATGLAQATKIASTKIPSATGSGFVSGGNSGTSTAQAPAFNLVQGTEGNQISEDVQGLAQEPVRAVVVSGDVTTAQSVDRNIETESGI